MGNCIQSNLGRNIKETKARLINVKKIKIFFQFISKCITYGTLKKCTFICFLPSFFSIVNATCLTFRLSSEPLPLTSSDSAISG